MQFLPTPDAALQYLMPNPVDASWAICGLTPSRLDAAFRDKSADSISICLVSSLHHGFDRRPVTVVLGVQADGI